MGVDHKRLPSEGDLLFHEFTNGSGVDTDGGLRDRSDETGRMVFYSEKQQEQRELTDKMLSEVTKMLQAM